MKFLMGMPPDELILTDTAFGRCPEENVLENNFKY